jgi:hypothetical protein
MKRKFFLFHKGKTSSGSYLIFFVAFFLIALLLVLFLTNRFLHAPKILLLCVIILVAVFLGKLKILMRDWFVFLAFVYLADSLRGFIYFLVCKFHLPVYTLYVIKMENFLFGGIPSNFLQNILLEKEVSVNFTWLEKFLTVIHGTHFIAFLFIGLIIWINKSDYFRNFKISFYLLISVGITGYFVIPTAPPWIAANLFKIIPDITHFNAILYNMAVPDLTTGFNTNPIAAMPSLHAAFPALCCLILWKLYRWQAVPFYIYSLLMLFAITYSGDHYVVDTIAGILLAIFSYFISTKVKTSHLKLKVKATRNKDRDKGNFLKKNPSLIIGVLLLAAGISIGLGIKNQLRDHYNMENLYIPKYVDFFRNPGDYADDYNIQFYFGNYFLYRGKNEKALSHFERALSLSQTYTEKKQALVKIQQCRELLNTTTLNLD